MHDITFETVYWDTNHKTLKIYYNKKLLLETVFDTDDIVRVKAALFALQAELFKEKIIKLEAKNELKAKITTNS
jgi:hypothetical protein